MYDLDTIKKINNKPGTWASDLIARELRADEDYNKFLESTRYEELCDMVRHEEKPEPVAIDVTAKWVKWANAVIPTGTELVAVYENRVTKTVAILYDRGGFMSSISMGAPTDGVRLS